MKLSLRAITAALAAAGITVALATAPAQAATTTVTWKTFAKAAGGYSISLPAQSPYGKLASFGPQYVPIEQGFTAKVYDVGTTGSTYAPLGFASLTFKKSLLTLPDTQDPLTILLGVSQITLQGSPAKITGYQQVSFGSKKLKALVMNVSDKFKKKAVKCTMLAVASTDFKRVWLLEMPNGYFNKAANSLKLG